MIRKHLAGALLGALGIASSFAVGAVDSTHVQLGRLGRVSSAGLAAHLQLEPGNTFTAGARLDTHRGTHKTRERQTFQGVPVYGRSVVVERDRRGNVLSVDGQVERNLSLAGSARPRLTAAAAQGMLKRRLGQSTLAASASKSRLFVYPQAGGNARLVYRTSYLVTVNGRPSRPTAIVDANSGEVLRQWDGLTTGRRPPGGGSAAVDVQANGPGGNELTGQYFYDGSGAGRELLAVQRQGTACYMRNDEVATYNVGQGNRVTLWSFGCGGSDPSAWTSSGDATNGAYSPINDAHHFGQVVQDMYANWFGEPALKNGDGSPMQLHMWVHYGTNYENAFWDGAEMVFGDGDSYFYPFVVLDITGHEISHGFTEQHSGLEYAGQSGGMNEAFSDMAGEAVKYYDRGSNDFMVGEDIVKPATVPMLGMPALRDMCTPSNDGASIDDASQYYDGLDVHYSSGVYNHAFCLLAKTSGWNTRKAFEVFHDANALYWGPQETFDSGACGVEDAAVDRGYPEQDVIDAFAGVGVTCPKG